MAHTSSAQFEFANEDGSAVRAHTHTNPNGKAGGWVADSAIVGDNVTVEVGALVGPGAVIPSGKVIHEGELITSDMNLGH